MLLDSPGAEAGDRVRVAALDGGLGGKAERTAGRELIGRAATEGGGEACVCDISDVGVSQPTVSHHLKKLKDAGLLSSERRGTWVYYRVEPAVLAAMGALLTTAGTKAP
ncbi:ArsR/SmtB family transcription factor [Streptomyces sp. ISL-94]|uniref:ArsR/SmtB family transcription factor n=1 Tax=Streptomyces sp. ISL-94 TaxID=2819190 RepID=UPI0035B4C86A